MDPNAPPVSEDAQSQTCPACGYSLHGIDSQRCPECGLSIDRARLSVSRIPWAHRQLIGRFRAYWRTNLIAAFRVNRLCDEINRPVSFRDAQRFRHVTVLLAWAPLAAVGFWASLATFDQWRFPELTPENRLGWLLEGAVLLSAEFSLWLFLLAGSGAGSYFFHPRGIPVRQQNRAIALSYYACAPLAWLWLPCGLAAVATWTAPQPWTATGLAAEISIAAWMIAAILLAVIVVVGYVGTLRLMRSATCRGSVRLTLRTIVMAAYLPLAWATAGVRHPRSHPGSRGVLLIGDPEPQTVKTV